MKEVKDYQKMISYYSELCDACVALLNFEKYSDHRKITIRKLYNEIIKYKNYNRIKSISKIVEKAGLDNNLSYSRVEMVVRNMTGKEKEEIRSYIDRLYNIGPKKYLLECINKIIDYQYAIKALKDLEKRSSKNRGKIRKSPLNINLNKTSTYQRKVETLEEIIKKHISEFNSFIEKNEIEDIKGQFGLNLYNSQGGYLSDNTIEKLFAVRIVNDILDRHEEAGLASIVDAMDALFELAWIEMDYRKKDNKNDSDYETALNTIKDTKRDYVEEYNILYQKVMRYYNKLSQEERVEFKNRIKSSHHIEDSNNLISPEKFRNKINRKVKEKIEDLELFDIYNAEYAASEISHYTKYMTASELANYYQEKKKPQEDDRIKKVFAILIESKMQPISDELSDFEQTRLREKRINAICNEYLNESIDLKDSNYAKSRIESREAVIEGEKRYFRQNKMTRAINLMNYNKLKKLSTKEILSQEEIQKVKGMF